MSLLGNLNTTSQISANIHTSIKQTKGLLNSACNNIEGRVNKSTKQIKGTLNLPTIQKMYVGLHTKTANVSVDNIDGSIKVDVKKVPNPLIINTVDHDHYEYDGSESLEITLADTDTIEELAQQIYENTENITKKQDKLTPDNSIQINTNETTGITTIGTTFKSNWFEFEENDWINFNANEVRLNIPQSQHLKSFPVIDTMLIYNNADQSWENNIPIITVLPNNTLVIKGTEKIKCKILLKGEDL